MNLKQITVLNSSIILNVTQGNVAVRSVISELVSINRNIFLKNG